MTTLTPATRNVTKVFRAANPDQIFKGLDWYADAHARAVDFAVEYGVTVDMAAGILAAFSPNNSWTANLTVAHKFFADPDNFAGYFAPMIAKARAIYHGASVLSQLTSDKVQNFYLCILSAGESDAVCIDRHAMDIAWGVRHADASKRPKLTPKAYAAHADAYRRAAVILSREYGMPISAALVQAVTWTVWRNRFWAVGAFDPEARVNA